MCPLFYLVLLKFKKTTNTWASPRQGAPPLLALAWATGDLAVWTLPFFIYIYKYLFKKKILLLFYFVYSHFFVFLIVSFVLILSCCNGFLHYFSTLSVLVSLKGLVFFSDFFFWGEEGV